MVDRNDGPQNVLLEVLVRLDGLLLGVNHRVHKFLGDLVLERRGFDHFTCFLAGADKGLEVVGVFEIVEVED